MPGLGEARSRVASFCARLAGEREKMFTIELTICRYRVRSAIWVIAVKASRPQFSPTQAGFHSRFIGSAGLVTLAVIVDLAPQ